MGINEMKKLKILLLIPVAGITLYILFQGLVSFYVLVPWAAPWVDDIIIANPSKPKITYGEFPFRLTYAIDGETKIIEDTLICEFNGFETNEEAGKYRKWESHLKSGNERVTLLNTRGMDERDSSGHKVLELYFYWGNAEYLMGDNSNKSSTGQPFDYVSYLYQNEDGTIGSSVFKSNVVWERYKIRLISWEPTPPIKNSFK
jgi:hypothetical protein